MPFLCPSVHDQLDDLSLWETQSHWHLTWHKCLPPSGLFSLLILNSLCNKLSSWRCQDGGLAICHKGRVIRWPKYIQKKTHYDIFNRALQSRRKILPEFSRLFQSHNYTSPEVIATKILVICQHLRRFLAMTFSPCMHRNGYFTWHLLGRVTTARA